MMKFKRFLKLFGLAIVAGLCFSCSNDDVNPAGETGSLRATFVFSSTEVPKANSTAIPITLWENVKTLQMLLYNSSGVVGYSAMCDVSGLSGTTGSYTKEWTDIPVDTYTAVFVANASTDYFGNTTANSIDNGSSFNVWTAANVVGKNVNQLRLEVKSLGTGAFPTHIISNNSTYSSREAFDNPSEIFMGSRDGIVIQSNVTNSQTSPAIELKREVSMMRLRVDASSHTNGPKGQVEFKGVSGASIMYARVPDGMYVIPDAGAGEGGVVGTSDVNGTVVAASGTASFKDDISDFITGTTLPTHYKAGGVMITDSYRYWKDIIVFPNATRSQVTAIGNNWNGTNDIADGNRKYFVIISGETKTAYELTEGDSATSVSAGTVLYWYGVADGVFAPNKIRELNITLASRGSTTPPTVVEYGGLEITVSAPLDWDSAIVSEDVEW